MTGSLFDFSVVIGVSPSIRVWRLPRRAETD